MPNLSHSKLDCSRHASCNVQQKAASKTGRPRSPAFLCIAFTIALLAGYTIVCALLCDREVSGFLCFSQRVTTPVAERKQHERQLKIDADRHRQQSTSAGSSSNDGTGWSPVDRRDDADTCMRKPKCYTFKLSYLSEADPRLTVLLVKGSGREAEEKSV